MPTLPSSGQITFRQVNETFCYSSTAQISLGLAAVRTLFAKASGQISINDGRGKNGAPPAATSAGFASCFTVGGIAGTRANALHDGNCGYYAGTVIYYNDCNNCSGTATGDGTQAKNNSEYCNGTQLREEYFLSNQNCATGTREVEANSCQCGGTGPGYCSELPGYPTCRGYNEWSYYFCDCNNPESPCVELDVEQCCVNGVCGSNQASCTCTC